MYFDLTDDQKELQRSLQALLRARLPENERIRRYETLSLDRALWRELAGLGLTGVVAPEAVGGLGLDLLTLAAAAEVLGAFAAPAPVVETAITAWALAQSGEDSHKAAWASRLAKGDAIGALALSEKGLGWQPEDWSFDEKAGGQKASVAWGHEASFIIVGLRGGELGVVEAKGEGVSLAPVDSLDRTRPLTVATFKPGAVTRMPGSGSIAKRLRDGLLVVLAGDAYGAGKRAVDMAIEYARVRTQFGRLIGSFQALKHQLANVIVELEPCKPLYWYAAHAWDAVPDDAARAAAIAKSHVTDVAVRSARAAVEAHGGIGYTWEYPLHIFLKRAMFDRATVGLPALHQDRAAVLAGW